MTINSASEGFVALSLSLEEDGCPHRVSFLDPTGEPAILSRAAVYAAPLQDTGSTEWVAVAEITETLSALFQSRSELGALLDFARLERDDRGVPLPFLYELRCPSCDWMWRKRASSRLANCACPRCAGRVDVRPWAARWVGPDAPALRALWARLPAPGSEPLELAGGLEVLLESNGIWVSDKAGNWVWVGLDRIGLVFELCRAGELTPTLISIGATGTVVRLPNGEVIEC